MKKEKKSNMLAGVIIFSVILGGCRDLRIEFLEPEQLTWPDKSVQAGSTDDVSPKPDIPARATTRNEAVPKLATGTKNVSVDEFCTSCHPIDMLEGSTARGNAWAGVVSTHVSEGRVELSNEERSALESELLRRFP